MPWVELHLLWGKWFMTSVFLLGLQCQYSASSTGTVLLSVSDFLWLGFAFVPLIYFWVCVCANYDHQHLNAAGEPNDGAKESDAVRWRKESIGKRSA